MNFSRIIFLSLFSAAFAVGCGGGGGDGSAPIQATADITETNALPITQEVLASTAATELVGDQIGGVGFGASASAVSDEDVLVGLIASAQLMLPSGAAVDELADIQPLELIPCDFGGFVDVNELSQTSVELTFDNCNGFNDADLGFDGVINGVMKLTINNIDTLDFTIVLTEFTISGLDDDFEANGRIRLRVEDLTDGDEIYHERSYVGLSNLTVSIAGTGDFALLNYDYTLEEKLSQFEDWLEEDFSGSMDGIDFPGVVNFNTVVPFRYDFDSVDWTAGEIFINGADGEEIHLKIDGSTENLIVEIDTDGDGEYDYFPQWTWGQITLISD